MMLARTYRGGRGNPPAEWKWTRVAVLGLWTSQPAACPSIQTLTYTKEQWVAEDAACRRSGRSSGGLRTPAEFNLQPSNMVAGVNVLTFGPGSRSSTLWWHSLHCLPAYHRAYLL